MSIVGLLINKESIRNKKMISEYEEKIANLPKGTIKDKKVGDKNYYYLCYREGKKVISKYIGKDADSLKQMQSLIEERKHIELMLKQLKQERQELKRMEASI